MTKICFLLLFFLSPHLESFSSPRWTPPLSLPCPSLLGGGIMWSSGELNTGAEAAAARWIIDGNLGVTRLGLLTSLLLHLTAGLTRQKGGRDGEREKEREEESIVWWEDAACRCLQLNYGWKDNCAPISVEFHLFYQETNQSLVTLGVSLYYTYICYTMSNFCFCCW